jgi:hypothetical protein
LRAELFLISGYAPNFWLCAESLSGKRLLEHPAIEPLVTPVAWRCLPEIFKHFAMSLIGVGSPSGSKTSDRLV